jgi:hypothetical protein
MAPRLDSGEVFPYLVIFDQTSLPNFEWQMDYWSRLFSYYNISYDNRHLTVMSAIYLPICNSENRIFGMKKKRNFFKDILTKKKNEREVHSIYTFIVSTEIDVRRRRKRNIGLYYF